MDCLFCNIAHKKIPSDIVYEDDKTLAFLDINPINPGHTLVIPKKHSENLYDITSADMTACMETAQKIANSLVKIGAQGINIGQNNGSPAGQVIFHTHFHIIPRYEKDGHTHWKGKGYTSEDESKTLAENIKQHI